MENVRQNPHRVSNMAGRRIFSERGSFFPIDFEGFYGILGVVSDELTNYSRLRKKQPVAKTQKVEWTRLLFNKPLVYSRSKETFHSNDDNSAIKNRPKIQASVDYLRQSQPRLSLVLRGTETARQAESTDERTAGDVWDFVKIFAELSRCTVLRGFGFEGGELSTPTLQRIQGSSKGTGRRFATADCCYAKILRGFWYEGHGGAGLRG